MEQNDKKFRHQLVPSHQTPGMTKCQAWLQQTLDTRSPASIRIEAIENLARECHEHQTFQTLRWLPQNTGDDEDVRRAVVRLLPNWGDGPMQLNALIRALSTPGVRGEAVKAMDSMAPLKGQREARLLDNLARLRAGGWNFLQVAALPKIYGRDLRVLDFLKEWMQTGNQWQRALSASELCGLGETEAAFGAVSDPYARVRKSLAVAIGYFNERSGAEILSRMLADDDAAVSTAAQISLELLRNPGMKIPQSEKTYGSCEWAALLKELSELRITDPQLLARLSAGGTSRSWLWETGATESQITALEQRIGRSLPPSYRSFLAESNGFQAPDIFIPQLYSTEAVDWFRIRHADWAQAYRDTYPHLNSCLQVSATRDGAVILLNPRVKSTEGEWQTYFFASWIPGATVHDSFGEFMRNELEQCCEWRNR